LEKSLNVCTSVFCLPANSLNNGDMSRLWDILQHPENQKLKEGLLLILLIDREHPGVVVV
jgi:hypothetical protein